MRLFIVKAACIAVLLSGPGRACSQSYYVVVGAFAAKDNASEFKGYLPTQLLDTSYSVSENENLLHFYVLKTSDKESAISRSADLGKIIRTWQDEEKFTRPAGPEGTIKGSIALASSAPEKEFTNIEGSSASASASASLASTAEGAPRPAGKYFKFLIESPEGKLMNAPLHHVDFVNGREVATYKSNTFVNPQVQSEPMAVVCDLVGYKEMQKYIDYSNPSAYVEEAYMDADGTWVIPYKLEPVEAGDVSVMYNVSFYKDAALMRKPAQADLDQLAAIMQSNPYYEITIHSYCNGRNRREILAPG
ncbi:MAG: hypothetical protein M3Y60_05405, partial [Bacteroidota bacterium]|nr:hypothetical protein [Bacteroidota bacterium]